MKKRLYFALLVIFLVAPVYIFGQGSGSSDSPKKSGGKSGTKSNFAINRYSSGIVSAVSASTITIKANGGKSNVFNIRRDTRFVGGRPRQGDKVKITYLAQNRQAILVRKN